MLAGVSGDWCSSGNFIVSRGTHVCNGEPSMPSGVKPDELDFENGISGALGDQLQVRECEGKEFGGRSIADLI